MEWIEVGEAIPKPRHPVVLTNGKWFQIGKYSYDRGRFYHDYMNPYEEFNPTHWALLHLPGEMVKTPYKVYDSRLVKEEDIQESPQEIEEGHLLRKTNKIMVLVGILVTLNMIFNLARWIFG